MRRRTRRIIFYICFLAFLGLSYVTILYAEGYKYSLNEGRFLRTGALSLKANTGARVFVDDELIGDTSFLSNAFSRDRLLPGRYTVRLQRDGYSSWQKVVAVEEGRVIDFPNVLILSQAEDEIAPLASEVYEIFSSTDIILNSSTQSRVKESSGVSVLSDGSSGEFSLKLGKLSRVVDGATTVIAERVAGFTISDSDRQILWWTQNELWVLWLRDVDNKQPYRKNGDKEMITRFASTIKKAGWFRGDDHIVVDAGGLKVVEIDKRGGINIIKI